MIRISSAALIFAVALLMAVAGAGGGAAAGERAPLALTGEDGSFSLRGHLEIFEDSGAGLGIGEVAAGGAFRPRSADVEERQCADWRDRALVAEMRLDAARRHTDTETRRANLAEGILRETAFGRFWFWLSQTVH